jgi:Family of unknown function (DUF6879)
MPDPAVLDELFRAFVATAWRLEVRTSYGLLADDRPYQDFLAGREPDLAGLTPWLDLMREQIRGRGKRVERVRVVDRPPSDFLRWEYHVNRWNAEAGEDIRYLTREMADDLHLPAYDFWIFDDAAVAFMVFAGSGEFTGPILVDDEAVTWQHLTYRDVAWQVATPYEQYRL